MEEESGVVVITIPRHHRRHVGLNRRTGQQDRIHPLVDRVQEIIMVAPTVTSAEITVFLEVKVHSKDLLRMESPRRRKRRRIIAIVIVVVDPILARDNRFRHHVIPWTL